jgi:iron complex outermembrane receptor protein
MSPVSKSGRNRGRMSHIRFGLVSTSSLLVFALLGEGPSAAQTLAQVQDPNRLPQVDVSTQRPQPRTTARPASKGTPQSKRAPWPTTPATPPAQVTGPGGPGGTTTPLNTNVVAESASRLGLTVFETPATVEIVDQQTMREQGYRTNAETANGAVGVLSIDAAGAPAGFSMRGFQFGEVNVLYNGISTGPQSITSRVMDTANLSQVEFLKGPSSLMSGLNAIGGSVNYVSRQPTSGPVRSELDLSYDSLGTYRTHYGSGGNTGLQGLDYRFDAIGSKVNGFIDDTFRNLTSFSGQLNYRASETFKTFVAAEYKQDSGKAYWGTPVVPTTFAGPFAKGGVVSGTAISTFDGALIAPVTFDTRTLKTNYNTLDNSTGAHELWLRAGFEWLVADNVTLKNQAYAYQAKRHWLDSETYAFNTTTGNTIDRDRFFVGHNQQVFGNNTDLVWDSRISGIENRFAAQLQASSNRITFTQHAGGFPEDTVDVINPDRGFYGVFEPDTINKQLNTLALSFEDRLKPTPWLAFIGGVRFEHMSLDSSRVNFDGGMPPANNFTQTWNPVTYRAAVTIEPIRNLMFYGMTATAVDPAASGIFSVANRPTSSFELATAKIYEVGVKHLFWDNRAEWTLSAYDITRRNVFVLITNTTGTTAGEIDSKGVEFAAAVRPIDGLKLWGNVAFTDAFFKNFDFAGFTGNAPSNVAPIIVNAGGSYRWDNWRWPVEIGGSVRHVGNRFLSEDNLTTMEAYTTADVFAFVDVPGRDFGLPATSNTRVGFRVRNLTNAVYAAFSDSGYPDQFYLGAPRTFEVSASLKW